jgi:hypothetical protein
MATARQTLIMLTALCGSVAASQAPEFAQQYRQRLGGALDEVHRVVEEFDRDAARSGLTRTEALETHNESSTRLFRDRGQSMRGTLARYAALRTQSERFEQAPPLARPLVVATNPDRTLLAGTWRVFEPALPMTAAGLAWVVAGFALGAALAWIVLLPFKRLKRRNRSAEAEHAS